MAIYRGDVKVSGNAMMVALPMFFATYQPRKLNNPSWLRADPYSWHSADLYVSAYAHLADNISGVTAQTETIAGTTITFYKLSDEIKVVLPDQQTNLDAIYNATGIGYYFVLDTTNRQFKLPRNIYGFTGYRGDVGGYVAPGLPNITGLPTGKWRDNGTSTTFSGASYLTTVSGGVAGSGGTAETIRQSNFDASRSNSIYGNSTTVQPPATQAYLYFYVGNTVQNETSVDVGEMSEAINDKADLALSNLADAGKEVAGAMSLPGSVIEELTVPSPETILTAPANGYFTFSRRAENSGNSVELNNRTSGVFSRMFCTYQNALGRVFVPCMKNDSIFVYYDGNNTNNQKLTFTYAKGSEPQQ